MSTAFTVDNTNWHDIDKLNELVMGINERVMAASYPVDSYSICPAFGTASITPDTYALYELTNYLGVVYYCNTAHTSSTFIPANWTVMLAAIGSDIQGRTFNTLPSVSNKTVDWWGWYQLQWRVEQMCSSFVESYDLSTGYTMWSFSALVAQVNSDDSTLFQYGDWTRTYRDGFGAIVTTGGNNFCSTATSDFIATDVMIREIVACLEYLTDTLQYERGGRTTPTPWVSDTWFDEVNAGWQFGKTCAQMMAIALAAWVPYNTVPGFRIEDLWTCEQSSTTRPDLYGKRRDVLPQTFIPDIAGVTVDVALTGLSAALYQTAYALPSSAPAKISQFANAGEHRVLYTDAGVASGQTLYVLSAYSGDGTMTDPWSDLGVACPIGAFSATGAEIIYEGMWMQWNFTNV